MNYLEKERVRWKKWAIKIEEYSKDLTKLISECREKDPDKFFRLKDALDKRYDHIRLYVGPWTEITDPEDIKLLYTSGFILPGDDIPFIQKHGYNDLKEAYGKRVVSELGKEYCGKVIGYGYDALDDYLVVINDMGHKVFLILNSRYEITDKEKED